MGVNTYGMGKDSSWMMSRRNGKTKTKKVRIVLLRGSDNYMSLLGYLSDLSEPAVLYHF